MEPAAAPGLEGLDRFVNRRELDALRPILAEGEGLRAALDGEHAGKHGLLAATDERILFVVAGLWRRRVHRWDYDDLDRLEVKAGIDDATLTLHGKDGAFEVTKARKAAAATFEEAVRLAIPQRTFRRARLVHDQRQADPVVSGNGTVERLRRLDRMRARRSITEPEYKVNRRRILEDAGLPTDLRRRSL